MSVCSPDINLQTHTSWVCQTVVCLLYRSVIISMFVHKKEHLRRTLLFLLNQKNKAVESHSLLVNHNGKHAPSIRTCETWFRQFKSDYFNVKDKSAKTGNCRRYWKMSQLKQHYLQQWLIWITHWSKNNWNVSKDVEKWFCYTKMPRLTHQNWRKTPWNRLDETSFQPHCNPLTLQHLSPLRIKTGKNTQKNR